MGVRGLSSFFDTNPELSQPHKLHDTRVVMDGNNVVNVLYFAFNVDCTCGGDYYRFSSVIKEYFSSYLKCSITPIVIFDGGYDKTDRKLQTTLSRTRNRIALAKHIAKHGSTCRVLPLLAMNVFKDVLEEMNITYAQCNFEADDQITAVANYYQCPVISQDSDFYIFDILGGFIRLDSIEVTVQKCKNDAGEEYFFLNCTLYHIDNFLSFFPGIEKNILPLFGTLIGNDFVDINTFETFFMNIKLPKVKSKLRVSKRHQRMIGLLAWLKSHSLSDGIEEVLRHLKKEKRSSVKELIKQTIEGYNVPISNLIAYLEGDQLNPDMCKNTLFSFKNNPLPCWFVKVFQEGSISPFLLNSVGLRRAFLMTQVEDFTLPSTYSCSLSIRKVLYGLLLSVDEDNSDDNCVEEYDRREEKLQKSLIQPTLFVDGFGKLPKLSEEQVDSEHGKLIVLCTLGEQSTHVEDLPKVMQLLVLCIRYWLKNCDPKPTDSFLDGLLLSILFLSVVQPLVTENVKTVQTDHDGEQISSDYCKSAPFVDVMNRISVSNASFFSKNIQKYFQKPARSAGKNTALSIVHSYSQLQSCLFSVLLLNDLLGSPFVRPQIHHALNGTLIYNLAREIKSRRVPPLFISETIGRDSTLDFIFSKLKRKIVEGLTSDYLQKDNNFPQQGKKKKKKLSQDSGRSSNSVTSNESAHKNSSAEISNKFDSLSLSDCESGIVDVFL